MTAGSVRLGHALAQIATIPGRLQRLPRRVRSVLTACLYGLAAGAISVLFQLAINLFYRTGLVRLAHLGLGKFILGSFLLMMGSSAIAGWLLTRFCPEAAGSGIPQLKVAFWQDAGRVPWRVAWVKFLAGVLSVGSGSSLGREGPSVQIAGTLASNLAAWTGKGRQDRRAALAAGSASGLAAAFNAPLAATTFVLEEIIGDLNSRYIGAVLLAAVLGALVVHGIIGKQPSFSLTGVESPTWIGYVLTPVVAACAGLVGVYFQRCSLRLRNRLKRDLLVPRWALPMVGAGIAWVLGVLVFSGTGHLGVFSLGYDDLSSALAGDIGWRLGLLLVVSKFIATFCCYGFGGCGGIFSPTLFFGGMIGVVLGGLLSVEYPLSHGDILTFAVVGMSACLGAVVWAPVTGIVIVFEMTHEFSLVPALMLGALVSQAIARSMNRHNFYDTLLEEDGHAIERVRPPRDLLGWEQTPVSSIANMHPVIAASLVPEDLRQLITAHAYRCFPVVQSGQPVGILTRAEIQRSLELGTTPVPRAAACCGFAETIGTLQRLLIGSHEDLVVIVDLAGGAPIGLVTAHDLLRAQAQITQRGERTG